ncbi:MAG: hypothetical protein R3Y63_07040 [Eubacteriales bacterium]
MKRAANRYLVMLMSDIELLETQEHQHSILCQQDFYHKGASNL